MAVKWAVANGNWADGTTWNDGVVPVSGDYVYCNGYTISFPTTINIGNGTITNELNPNTNRNGGHIQSTSGGVTIVANLIADGGGIFVSGHLSNSIIGDVAIRNCIGMSRTGNTLQSTWRFTGNISVENGQIATDNSATYQVIITGNANLKNRGNGKQPVNFTINGNIMIENYNITATNNLTINGLLTAIHCRAYGSNVVKSGNIHYVSDNSSLTIGIAWQTLNLSNISEWRDISEIRSNPFIILTDAEMNNRQQYPPEDVVKQGVEYVWGEKVGTYQQPPESVVLKGYRYDNDEKEGTLENEVTVNVGCTNPQDVRKDIPLANMGIVGTMVIPSPENVLEGTIYDNGTEGTLESQSTADYPAEDKVLIGTSYDHDNMTGTLEPGGDNPQESDVRFGVPYNHNLNTGNAHIPSSQDVRKNVPVEDTVGQIVIPRASEVKKDVEFDIDSVGTMESVVETNNTINVYRKSSSI